MIGTFKIVKVDYKYCDYLRRYDSRVSFNAGSKSLRPYVGVLLNFGNIEYFAPLSSPKKKHKSLNNTIDLIKIDKGKLGVINLNNMIPVTKFNYTVYDLSNRLSKRLYYKYINKTLSKNIIDRCCNFPLLEIKCMEYNNITN